MSLRSILRLTSALAVLAAAPSFADAATQGTLGVTSTGIVNLSITKSVQAQISDLTDMTLPNWSIGDPAVQLTSNVCVYSSTGNYRITATGSGLANIFTLGSGLNLLAYSVTWNAGGAGALGNTGTTLLPGIASPSFTTASLASVTCGGSATDTARVIVGVPQTVMTLAASSNTAYTGTLTLLVTPF